MAEKQHNLWAPWRMEYIDALSGEQSGGCFLCRYRDAPAADRENYVVYRSAAVLVVLNRFPYSSGHLLVAPLHHAAALQDHPESTLTELSLALRDATRVLQTAFHAEGFNIGLNMGRCAGAGLPDHLHWHVVPRWSGDTNFMPVIGDVKVLPEALQRTAEKFTATASELGVLRIG